MYQALSYTAAFGSRPCPTKRQHSRSGAKAQLSSCAQPKRLQRARSRVLVCRSGTTISPHPDALKRRKEAEERQKKRTLQGKDRPSEGRAWWDVPGPSNIVTCSSPSEFKTQLENAAAMDSLVVVKFFAPHCIACKTMYPKVKQIADQNPEVTFLKVNASSEELRAMSEKVGVSKVPYFHFYKQGALVSNFSASLTTIKRLRSEIQAYSSSDE